MNLDQHVYCTECTNFRLDDEEIPYCPWEDRCEINNCEDSMPFRDRPYWKKNKICQMCFETEAMEGFNVCKECYDTMNEEGE